MSADYEEQNVIIFFGPPHAGKTKFYHSHLASTHERVAPEEEFAAHPHLTLRQLIITRIVTKLKEGLKVAIDDENWSYAKRDSYVSLIRKKVPSCKFLCLVFSPLHGHTQLRWHREYQVAERWTIPELMTNPGWEVKMKLSDRKLACWQAAAEGALLQSGIDSPDPPRNTEGYDIKEVKTHLQSHTFLKFEVPVLFVQWEGAVSYKDGDPVLVRGVAPAMREWYKHNPGGRVILLQDGQAGTGDVQENEGHLKFVLKELCKEIDDCPVYGFHIHDSEEVGAFCGPPEPGIVVFLQRLHHLDILHKNSMYVQNSQNHQKMAHSAGIKHIKSSRIFQHLNLARSSHGATSPPQPKVLASLELITPPPGGDLGNLKVIPLYHEAMASKHCLASGTVGSGRILYICAQNQQVLERYQSLYKQHASGLKESRCGFKELSLQTQAPAPTPSPQSSRATPTQRIVSLRDHSRELPKWMRPKGEKGKTGNIETHASASSTSANTSSIVNTPSKRKSPAKPGLKSVGSSTVYVMSVAELVDTAREILLEAGKTVPTDEEIAIYLSKKEQGIASSGEEDDKTSPRKKVEKKAYWMETEAYTDNAPDDVLQDFFEERVEKKSPKVAPSSSKRAKDVQLDEESREHHDIMEDLLLSDVSYMKKKKLRKNRETTDDADTVTADTPQDGSGDDSVFKKPKLMTSSHYVSETREKSLTQRPSIVIGSSFVQETASEKTQTKKPSIVVGDSFIPETSSAKDQFSKPSITVGDSFISQSASEKSQGRKPSIVLGDSFVPRTDSHRPARSQKADLNIPDTLVTDTFRSQQPRRTATHLSDDELIPETSKQTRSVKASVLVPDSFVPETITTVPETILRSQKCEKKTQNESHRHYEPDFSILDDII